MMEELQKCGDLDLFAHEISMDTLVPQSIAMEHRHSVFLESKVRESSGIDKEYFLNSQNVHLERERQVGSSYYITLRNDGRIFS